MSQEVEAKLDVLKRTHLLLGKIVDVQARLTLIGEDALAKPLETLRGDFLGQIERLQGQIANKWTVDAVEITKVLSKSNTEVQTQIRNIRANEKTADSVINILGLLDKNLGVLKQAGGSRDH